MPEGPRLAKSSKQDSKMGQGDFYCKRPAQESFRAPWVKLKPLTSKRTLLLQAFLSTLQRRVLLPRHFIQNYSRTSTALSCPSTHFPRGHRLRRPVELSSSFPLLPPPMNSKLGTPHGSRSRWDPRAESAPVLPGKGCGSEARGQDQGISLKAQATATPGGQPSSNAWAVPLGST